MTIDKQTSYYRWMEIVPALLVWGTFILMILLSFLVPAVVAIFIILFDVYWFLKTVYFAVYLHASYKKLRVNMKTDWLEKLQTDERTKERWQSLWHLIVLPMVKEEYEVVRETFVRLSGSNYPRENFLVVLALEERAGEHAQEVGKKIEAEFGKLFGGFLVTTHPQNIPGEHIGKGSNESWAVHEAKDKIIDARHISGAEVIVSVFDIDTQIYPDYFGILSYTFLTTTHPLRSSYQPVPFFINNIFEAPALSRIIGFSGTFWHLMQQSTPEKLVTFSSHSMPYQALVDIGFWHTDVVSEDSHIFFQCLTHYEGDWRTVPLFYPVSMDANVARTFWGTMINMYKQQRRWAWGSENVAYLFSEFKKHPRISWRTKFFWKFNILEGFHSWATNSIIIFALGWLPIFIGGQAFRITMLAYNLPSITQWILTGASFGIVTTAALSLFLLPPKPEGKVKWWQYVYYFISWALMPITLIIFGAFPAIDAQTRLAVSGKWRLDFWVTPKHRKAMQ
ncbi:MAG: glycosyltransferase family 2 protein [Patescibacteria group bacterium]|nr:glycosyltransferase family 2 protein [Patescibacteria group bacterium]